MPTPPTSPVPEDPEFEGPRGESSSEPVATEEIRAAVRGVFAPHLGGGPGARANLWRTWRGILRSLLPLGAVSRGNRVQVMAQGDRVFRSMWSAIEGARLEVVMTTYTLEPDALGRRTLEVLSQAARRGCAVTLMYDSVGSSDLEASDLAPLLESGARVQAFNPFWRRSLPLSRWVRNHQKILVIDNSIAFAGGMNVGVGYGGPELGTGLFRDTHLRLEGPCVPELARLVLEEVGAGNAALEKRPQGLEIPSGLSDADCLVQILESNVRRHQRAIQKALRTTVARSVNHCYLCTPYFVPPPLLIWALKRAARRGIDVRILTAGVSDVPAVRMASHHLYGSLLKAGVRIFEFQAATLHAKTMTVDGVYAAVGSFNLDYWSDRRNLEVNVSFLDVDMAVLLENHFHSDLGNAREIKLSDWKRRPLWQRLLHRIAYFLLSM